MASRPSSPVNRQPNELLAGIFDLILPEPVEEAVTDINEESIQTIPPRNLLRVCRRWRDIVSSTPKLWTQWALVVDVDKDNQLGVLTHFLQQYVALSRDSPLSFYMSIEDSDPDPDWEDFLRALLLTQCRWRRVSLYGAFSIDAGQLALAPLTEFRLWGFLGSDRKLSCNSDRLTLDALKVLHLHDYHPSYLMLLLHATNIEELNVADMHVSHAQVRTVESPNSLQASSSARDLG